MFARVTIRAADKRASQRFYDTVLPTLGRPAPDFAVEQADATHRITRGLHIGFGAESTEIVDAFWKAGCDAGYRDDGAPGPRPVYRDDYYGAFLLDPDGNSAEAACHGALRSGGIVDHLWIRVADVAASKRFYEGFAADAGLRIRSDTPERVQFTTGNGSFSLVAGQPSENVCFALRSSRPAQLRDPDGNLIDLVTG